MRRRRPRFGLLLSFAVTVLALGCGGNDEESERGEYADSGDSGGFGSYYNTSDEEPGFGDEEILGMVEDEIYPDPFADQITTQSIGDTIHIRVLWGNLIVDPDQEDAFDYSGEIRIDDGLLVIERTVMFDFWDTEIETREDPTLVAWHSNIRPHYDGLVLRLEPGATADDENFLHIGIGPYTRDLSVTELLNLLLLEPTGNDDDHVAIASHLSTGEGSGFVSGRWRDLPEREGGVLKAKWESGDGELYGHTRCRYIPDSDTTGAVKGKYIDVDGNFMGLLEGTYTDTPDEEQSGAFDLDWLDDASGHNGRVQGIYLKRDTFGNGFALANWWTE